MGFSIEQPFYFQELERVESMEVDRAIGEGSWISLCILAEVLIGWLEHAPSWQFSSGRDLPGNKQGSPIWKPGNKLEKIIC